MTAALDVVVIGGAGVDTNAYTTADLAPGDPGHAAGVETHFVRVRDYVGQTGGFASRLYAALGKRVAYVGGVGDDALGGLVRATLAGDGVDLSAVTVDPAGRGPWTPGMVRFVPLDPPWSDRTRVTAGSGGGRGALPLACPRDLTSR